MEVITENTRLADCTVGQLFDYIRIHTQPNTTPLPEQKKSLILKRCGEVYYKGVAGVMELFSIGRSKALEYIASDWMAEAVLRDGRIILVNRDMAVSLYRKRFGKAQ